MISAAQLQAFDERGAVTLDTPLTASEIAAANAAIDQMLPMQEPDTGQQPRYRYGATCNFYAPTLVDLIQHPFFEAVACDVLRSKSVHLWWGLSPIGRMPAPPPHPDPDEQWTGGSHVDIQATLQLSLIHI